VRIADAKIQHLVETARSEQCLVKQIGSVGCSNDEDAASALFTVAHTVQLGEQLRDNAIHDTAAVALIATLGCDRVKLIEEDHAGPCVSSTLEDTPYIRFRFANVHVKQFRSFDREEVEAELRRDSFGKKRLARAWWTIEEDTASLLQTLRKELWA
jgi:hypothetical protein